MQFTKKFPFKCVLFTEFIDQVCPKAGTNERKYVRIRTFNDKYIFAYATAGLWG